LQSVRQKYYADMRNNVNPEESVYRLLDSQEIQPGVARRPPGATTVTLRSCLSCIEMDRVQDSDMDGFASLFSATDIPRPTRSEGVPIDAIWVSNALPFINSDLFRRDCLPPQTPTP
jgi:hypothetical protein